MGSLGVCCFGSTERALGITARVTGRLDDAIAHLEAGVDATQRLGNRPVTAIARAELADALLARDERGDRERAAALVAHAIDDGVRIGMETRVRRWLHLQETIADGDTALSAARCVRDANRWELVANDERATVRHTVGMGYLAALLAAPGTDIAAGSLAGLLIVSSPQEVYDTAALDALRRRVAQLEEEIDGAIAAGHADKARRLERELEEIISHARAATGLGGRSRHFDDATERARTSVQKAIRRAIANIAQDAPKLAAALSASVHTGYWCRYEPRAGAPEHWQVHTD